MGIRGKMILLVGGTVLAFGALSLLGLYRFWSLTRERLDDVLVKRVEAATLAYDQWMESQKRQTMVLANVFNASHKDVELSDLDLQKLSGQIGHFDGLFFVDASGSIVHSSVDSPPLEPETVARLLKATKQESTRILATFEADGQESTRLFVTAPTASGGAVVAQIDSSRLGEVLDDIRLSEGSALSVIDLDGNVLYRRRGTERSFDPRVTSKDLVDSIRDKAYTITEDVSPHDGIRRVYGLARAGDGQSIVAIGQAADHYYSPLWGGLYQRIAIASLILVVSVGITLAVAFSIVGPVRMLQKATSAFASGERAARAKTNVSGELGELARGFNSMADQINAREDKLKEADRLRSEFVSSVSHELKTPLTTIKTLTHVLDSEALSEEERQKYLNMIDAECNRQISFVSDLLDAAVVEEATPEKDFVEIDLPSVVRDSISREILTAEAKQVHIVFEPTSALPHVVSNTDSLQRILRVLLENAIRVSPSGSKVDVSARLNAREIEVSISDEGPGIDGSDLPFIFDKFYRGRNQGPERTDGENRVGLGLFIARNLANQIGSRIEAQNGKAGGAVFSVFVPITNGKENGSSDISS